MSSRARYECAFGVCLPESLNVMPGLIPGIHVLPIRGVDGSGNRVYSTSTACYLCAACRLNPTCGNKSGDDDSSLHSCQELLGYQGSKPVVLDNEFADVFMQAALKNSFHAAVLQQRANAARLP